MKLTELRVVDWLQNEFMEFSSGLSLEREICVNSWLVERVVLGLEVIMG